MDPRYQEFLQDVMISLHMNLHELEDRKGFAAAEELDYVEAKLSAYREMIAILRTSAKEFDVDIE
jgi:hypothetical protein